MFASTRHQEWPIGLTVSTPQWVYELSEPEPFHDCIAIKHFLSNRSDSTFRRTT
jgi:hypothetical protein